MTPRSGSRSSTNELDQERWHWRAADRALADAMSTYWTNFVKTGDPNGVRLPRWPAFAANDGKVLYLGDPITIGDVPNLRALQVFDAVYAQIRGAPFKPASRP